METQLPRQFYASCNDIFLVLYVTKNEQSYGPSKKKNLLRIFINIPTNYLKYMKSMHDGIINQRKIWELYYKTALCYIIIL